MSATRQTYSICFHKLINDEYCENCGAIYYQNEFLYKHIKYNYPCELSPQKLCHEMIASNSLIRLNELHSSIFNIRRNRIYLEKRREIKTLLKNMNTNLDNNSSTYFLALLYTDLIFQNYSLEEIFLNTNNINRYNPSSSSSRNVFPIKQCLLIAVCCLVIASKFNEKDPHVPDLNSFIRIYNQNSKFYFIFSLEELRETEVIILKLLKYKLNYYSLYQFITFFFANGILFEKNIKQINANKKNKNLEKKILEKIYVKSREIVDIIIDDYEKYFMLFNGKENYITAIEILLWSIEYALDIKVYDEDNYCYFPNVYNINIDYDKHLEIYSIINEINNSLNNDIYHQPNTEIVNNFNYNFEYGNKIVKSDLDIINKYININEEKNNLKNNNNNKNNNLCLMSITNFDQLHKNDKSERLSSGFRNKNYKVKYYFKQKYKNSNITDYFEDTQDISAINKLNTILPNDVYNKQKEENNENKNINNILDENNDNNSNNNSIQPSKNKYQYYGISRNSVNELKFNRYNENEKKEKNEPFRNYIRNYNEINPYSTKVNIGKNNRYSNNNIISNSTFSKSWFNKTKSNINNINNTHNTIISPKNILNKTKKIFDETNKSNNNKNFEENSKINNKPENNNNKLKNSEDDDSINYLINSYINKSNYTILKSMNNDKKEKNILNVNDQLSDSNIVYKIKNNNKYTEERQKENSIIINNNIQINNFNYVTKEPNTYNYYYNNSQQNMSERENINMNLNIDDYINKKYFNINNTSKNNNNYYLLNKISKLKNKRKINFKKNNFLGQNNNENKKEKENSKENKINNNADFISTIKKMENFKMNKEKNKNFLNLGSFETYFDYGSYSRRKNNEPSTKKEYNIVKSINYKNSSYIENNENKFERGSNNPLFRANDKLNKFNRDLDISERYRKINSEFNM